jgi:ribonuclease HI
VRSGNGTAGYVIIGSNGEELFRVGEKLQAAMTNNEAEATALALAL